MNPNDSELEQQLRRLRPRGAGGDLEERIAASLDRRAATPAKRTPTAAILRSPNAWSAWLRGAGWALAGAAAAMAALALIERRNPSAPATPVAAVEAFGPSESTEELVTAEDEGLVLGEDHEPVRQVRYHSLERHVWVDPRSGARMEFEIPREDVRFVSVAMQ